MNGKLGKEGISQSEEGALVDHRLVKILEVFQSRQTVDPRFDIKKEVLSDRETIHQEWPRLLNEKLSSQGEQILYLHVPFCVVRCPFCRFFKNFSRDQETIDEYTNYLVREIDLTASQLRTPLKPAKAIYFGGGTPSLLDDSNADEIFLALRRNFALTDDCEITLEGRVEDVEPEKISLYIRHGINRFSLGVQSFNTGIRNKMGRPKTRETVLDNLSVITANDAAVVSVDLIYGLPNQTIDVWEQDLLDLVSTGVDAVDTYQLEASIIKQLMGDRLDKYYLADQAVRAQMFQMANDILSQNGFVRMNNTHWARGNRERNLYTTLTRSGVNVPQNNVLAFGSGAIGRQGSTRYQISSELQDYYHQIDENNKPLDSIKKNLEFPYIEELTCQIDSGEIIPEVFAKQYGINIIEMFGPLIADFCEKELLVYTGSTIKLTEAGIFWKSNVALAFIENRSNR